MLVMQSSSAAIGQLLTPPPVVMLVVNNDNDGDNDNDNINTYLKEVIPDPQRTPLTFSPIRKLFIITFIDYPH